MRAKRHLPLFGVLARNLTPGIQIESFESSAFPSARLNLGSGSSTLCYIAASNAEILIVAKLECVSDTA